MRLTTVALFVATTFLPSVASSDIIIGSWNIKNLGWNNNKDYEKVSHIAQHFDIVAIQELMNEGALERLEVEVEESSGEKWTSMASHALGRSTYREHYAFLWRESAVSYVSGAVVYIDDRDLFAREPFSAKFSSVRSGQVFALANVHITYGSSIGDRLPEIEALASYWEWLDEVYPDTPRLIAGDFNLRPDHQGWSPMRELGAVPAISEGASTLGLSEGVWANLYDNFWKTPGRLNVTDRGIVQFPALFERNHVTLRDTVSDHAPVWIALGDATLELTAFDDSTFESADDEVYCIDLNEATVDQLSELPNVGPVRAGQIIEMRPWGRVEELTRVSGLGMASVKAIVESGLVCS
jgi:endonuclease/exonuclease/phosphatase family metal-dependent hydrolase